MSEVWVHDDGGRAAAGFRGSAGDCVPRAIAIAQARRVGADPADYGEVYRTVYERLAERVGAWSAGRSRSAEYWRAKGRGATPRNGTPKPVWRRYLTEHGWLWTPTMGIGTGCTVHLSASELPGGVLIVSTSRHLVAMIDGVIHDTHDPTRDGTRCVYGYWSAP